MSVVLFGGIGSSLYCLVLLLTSVFLILLILVQRGRGGGLSGAFGGMGGQSAFGTKAGDTFTRITIVASAFWIILCISGAMILGRDQQGLMSNTPSKIPATSPLGGEFSDDLDFEGGAVEATVENTATGSDEGGSDEGSGAAEPAGEPASE
jgi:preprotein translocase subunit SecG